MNALIFSNPNYKNLITVRTAEFMSPIIPLSCSAWKQGVKDGRYPSPIKIGANTTVWRSGDIQKLVDDMCAGKMS